MGPFPVSKAAYSLPPSTSIRALGRGFIPVGTREQAFVVSWLRGKSNFSLLRGWCVSWRSRLCAAMRRRPHKQKTGWICLSKRKHTLSPHVLLVVLLVLFYILRRVGAALSYAQRQAFICLTVPCLAQGSQAGLPDLGSITGI